VNVPFTDLCARMAAISPSVDITEPWGPTGEVVWCVSGGSSPGDADPEASACRQFDEHAIQSLRRPGTTYWLDRPQMMTRDDRVIVRARFYRSEKSIIEGAK